MNLRVESVADAGIVEIVLFVGNDLLEAVANQKQSRVERSRIVSIRYQLAGSPPDRKAYLPSHVYRYSFSASGTGNLGVIDLIVVN